MAYVGDYLSKPEYNVIPFDTGRGGSLPTRTTPPPHIIQVVYDAAHGARISVPEAWNMPIGEAYIAQAMYFKMQGAQVDFFLEEERQFQKQLIAAGVK